jgi:hypothetical protein
LDTLCMGNIYNRIFTYAGIVLYRGIFEKTKHVINTNYTCWYDTFFLKDELKEVKAAKI